MNQMLKIFLPDFPQSGGPTKEMQISSLALLDVFFKVLLLFLLFIIIHLKII